jgi:hypothetical protein
MGMRDLPVDYAEKVHGGRLFSTPFAGDRRPKIKTPTGWLFGKHPSLQSLQTESQSLRGNLPYGTDVRGKSAHF